MASAHKLPDASRLGPHHETGEDVQPGVTRFGVFELDGAAQELRKNGARVKLQEQPFQLLSALLERPGQIVTREELRGKLWPADTFVDFDNSLNAAVKRVRDALGDSADTPVFIETVARRGYRWVAPVSTSAPASAVEPPAATRSVRWFWLMAISGSALLLLLGLGIGRYASRRGSVGRTRTRTRTERQLRPRRLLANAPELPIRAAVLSPNGKLLAYSDPTGFYLREVDSGETHPVRLPKDFDATPESWFPDGGRLLVSSTVVPSKTAGIAGLWIVSVTGGAPHKLSEDGWGASVSPDGSQVAFTRGTYPNLEIWMMRADGEQQRRLVGQEGDFFGAVSWDPAGNRLAYVRGRFHPGSEKVQGWIEMLDLTTGRTQIVLSAPGLYDLLNWTADGRLVYGLEEEPPNPEGSNLWAVRINAATGLPAGTPARLTNDTGFATAVSASSDGRRLVFIKRAVQPDVYIARLTGGKAHLSAPQRFTFDERADLPYAWTADSKTVIFISDRDGVAHIFKQAVGMAAPELLAGGPDPISIARLNPAGTEVLYLSSTANGNSNLRRLMSVPLAGGPPRLVLQQNGINNHQCARAPSTLCVFSVLRQGQIVFFTFDPDTGKSRPLTVVNDPTPYAFNWTLSPEGGTLAVAKKLIQPKTIIHLLPTGGGKPRDMVVQGCAGLWFLDWAADGKSLWGTVFTGGRNSALVSIDLRGRVTPLLKASALELGWAIPSPDGRQLAFWEASGSSNVWMSEHF